MNLKKIFSVLALSLLIALLVIGCSSGEQEDIYSDDVTEAVEELPVFTLETLAEYDGLNGNPAYVGYEGKVYDVTNISAWKDGLHQGEFQAGKDYTEVLNNDAPHSSSNLTDNAPVVGILE